MERIQRALDGELPIDGLTPGEREELQRHRARIDMALAPIRCMPAIDVAPAVLRHAGLRFTRPRRAMATLARAVDWLWSPRTLTLRPAYALAGAVALVAAASLAMLRSAMPAAVPAPAQVIVQFRLGDAEARDVALVGDFNGWHPAHRLHQVQAGVWSVDVALTPGVYHYVFVVDGKVWRLDPLAPRVTDGFGGASSRISVLAPEARS